VRPTNRAPPVIRSVDTMPSVPSDSASRARAAFVSAVTGLPSFARASKLRSSGS
jgi:hypothetical protein